MTLLAKGGKCVHATLIGSIHMSSNKKTEKLYNI